YFHKLGTPPDSDSYSLGKDFPRIAEIALTSREDDPRYLLATVANGDGGEFAHYVLGPAGKWTQLTHFADQVTGAAFGPDDMLFLLSHRDAPRGQALRLPLSGAPLDQAKLVVPESDGAIEGFLPTAGRLYVADLVGGPSRLRVFDLDGKPQAPVPLSPVAAV